MVNKLRELKSTPPICTPITLTDSLFLFHTFFFFVKNLAPSLPTMQLDHQRFGASAMLAAANMAASRVPQAETRSELLQMSGKLTSF